MAELPAVQEPPGIVRVIVHLSEESVRSLNQILGGVH